MPGCSVLKDAQDEGERPFPCNVETDLKIFPCGAEYVCVCEGVVIGMQHGSG